MGFKATKEQIEALEASGATVGPTVKWPTEFEREIITQIHEMKKLLANPPKKGTKEKSTVIQPITWKAFGIPQPEPEFKFCQDRRWKIDYAWPEIDYNLVYPFPEMDKATLQVKLAFEIEGGIWQQGRHNRPSSMIAEMEKYNRLACLGWRLIRCTPEQAKDGSIFKTIREALGLENQK